jgi:hypothetical protein
MGSNPGTTGLFGGNVISFAQSTAVSIDKCCVMRMVKPTMLKESEAILDTALVRYEEEAAVLGRLVQGGFLGGDFRAELNPVPNDSMRFVSRCWEVGSRKRLAGMSCEGTPFLRRWVILEVVVSGWISAENRVVSDGRNIDWCSCARHHRIIISVRSEQQENCTTYRSSISQRDGPPGAHCPNL